MGTGALRNSNEGSGHARCRELVSGRAWKTKYRAASGLKGVQGQEPSPVCPVLDSEGTKKVVAGFQRREGAARETLGAGLVAPMSKDRAAARETWRKPLGAITWSFTLVNPGAGVAQKEGT